MSLTNKAYDFLKSVALIWLPAIGTLYFAIAGIWGFPDASNVVGTITAVDACLGAILGLSSKTYSGDGSIVVSHEGLEQLKAPNLTLQDLANKKSVTLKVETTSSIPPAASLYFEGHSGY